MRALIRKHGHTPTKPSQDEVFLESSWPDWMHDGYYGHLTDENLGYALCEDCPDDPELTVDDFEVTERTKTVPNKYGEGDITVRYWTAVYTPRSASPVQSTDEEIAALEARLAELRGDAPMM